MTEKTKYKFYTFYSSFVRGLPLPEVGEDETAIKCPFHNDTTPSLHINLETGFWNCKACDAGQNGNGGDPAAWLVEWLDIPLGEALKTQKKYDATGVMTYPLDPIMANDFYEAGATVPKAMELLRERRGFTEDTIAALNIGYDVGTQRYTFPVYSYKGDLLNIRKYKMGAKKAKVINVKGAYTKSYLWPLDQSFINATWAVLFEGETDTALARQMGIPAITQTGGAGQWPRGGSMNHYFRGKKLFICYDGDDAGRSGAEAVAMQLREVAGDIMLCEYPKEGLDFTDYIIGENKTKEDFYDEVIKKSTKFVPKVEEDLEVLKDAELSDSDYTSTTLSQATYDPKYSNINISLEAMVVGRNGAIYSAPKVVRVTAPRFSSDDVPGAQCVLRNLSKEQLQEGYDISFGITREMLSFVGATDLTREDTIKAALGVPRNCNMYKFEEVESYNIEQLFIGPSVEKFSRDISDDSVDTQTAYHVYSGAKESVISNKTYSLKGVRTHSPKDSSVAFIITHAKPLKEEVDFFKPTEEELAELKVFQVAGDQTVKEKMWEIAQDIEYYTRIWDRKELIIAYDLVYHSALRFFLDNKLVSRGWLELVVVGDPRTGKSETAEAMLEYYQAGDMIEVENSRLTGLTGTVQQLGGDQWTITWGKFPQNDRKLLVLDEASGLSKDDFGAMSSMRSRGIVEINKAKIGQAYARTRSIWISNPRVKNGAKHMKDFPYGAKAIIDLVGRSEDIARFDFAMGVGRDEVPEAIINQDVTGLPKAPVTYTSELCQRLVKWAWSRNSRGYLTDENDKVRFTEDARRQLLRKASEIGKTYDGSSVAIVERNSMKIKLARLSVACAARLFSTDENYEKIIVRSEHVDFVTDFLDELYSNPTFGYRAMAESENRRHSVTGDDQLLIFRYYYLNPNVVHLIDQIKGNFTSKVLEEALDIGNEEVKPLMSQMMKLDLIYVATAGGGTQYKVTHKWNDQLREYMSKTKEEVLQIIKL